MIFTISKTSGYNTRPCIEAVKRTFPIKGKSHKTKPLWTIEIKTLFQLLKFITKQNESIIIRKGYITNSFDIEIYDDYRE